MNRIPMGARTRAFIREEEEKCIGCKACMKGCPMLEEWCENPKDLLGQLADKGDFPVKMPYTCLLCDYCTHVCPKDISFRHVFFSLRQETIGHFNGVLPRELGVGGVRLHQRLSASGLISTRIPPGDTLFFPGCALLAQSPAMIGRAYAWLRKKIPGLTLTNRCCYKPTEYLGDAQQFAAYQKTLRNDLDEAGVKTILTDCSNCYMSFRRHMEGIRIRSVYEVLAETGIPEEKKNAYRDFGPLWLHDPCPTRGETAIQEAVRALAGTLGLASGELAFHKNRTLCCGTGGMVKMSAPSIHEKHVARRAAEGEKGSYLTYCRECAATLTKSGRPTVHLLDFIFSDGRVLAEQSLLKTWTNRIGARKLAKKEHG